jgi:DNA-binding transcriptional LysR family regulator
MELRHIRYFLAVAEERHFTRAAAKVGIGQPPLSQQIKDLEAEIGAALFRRVAHGAELTPAGEAFLEMVQEMPALAEHAKNAARRASRGEVGSLRVGFTASAAFNPVVPSAIRAFRRAYPGVALSLAETNTIPLAQGLRDGTLDAAFLRPGDTGSDGLHLRHLSEEPMLVVLPSTHPIAASAEIKLAMLRDEPLLMFPRAAGPTLFDTIIAACRKAGFEPELGQSAPQIATLVTLVAADLGFSVVPASMRQVAVAGVIYRELAGVAPLARLALAIRRGESSRVVQNFVARAVA